MTSILFGLLAALSWGAGDFSGGMASRKTGAYLAVLYGEILGLAFLLIGVPFLSEPFPDFVSLLYALIAGALGTVGLVFLYQAMDKGQMSIAAPVSALLAAALPVMVGAFTQGAPGLFTWGGFILAFSAVWLISRSDVRMKDLLTHLSDLRLPLLAGAAFGAYFTLMHLASQKTVYWPIMIARFSGSAVFLIYMSLRRTSWKPARASWPFLFVNALLDVSGNFFYVLAGQTGRLDVSAVLSSLFPGATVLLAWLILKERLTRPQWLGIGAALIAIVLFTL